MSESEIQCEICKKCFSLNDVTPSRFVRPSVADLIKEDHPEWSNDSFVCQEDLNIYRSKYIQNALMASKGQLTALEKEVIENVRAQDILTENINDKIDEGETLATEWRTVSRALVEAGRSFSVLGSSWLHGSS